MPFSGSIPNSVSGVRQVRLGSDSFCCNQPTSFRSKTPVWLSDSMPKSMGAVFAPDNRQSGRWSACRLASVANGFSAAMLTHPLELSCVSASTLCGARLIITRETLHVGFLDKHIHIVRLHRPARASSLVIVVPACSANWSGNVPGAVRLRGLTRWSSAPTRGTIVAMATTLMIVLRHTHRLGAGPKTLRRTALWCSKADSISSRENRPVATSFNSIGAGVGVDAGGGFHASATSLIRCSVLVMSRMLRR